MRAPLAWAGAVMAVGAVSGLWVRPSLALCLGVALLAAGAAALLPRGVGKGCWLLGALALGLGAVAAQPGGARLEGERRLVGRLIASSGVEAVLRTAEGELALRFPELAPPAGLEVAVWVAPGVARARLPGSWPAEAADALAGRPAAKVRRAVLLGATPAPPALEGARHAGLLRALATGRTDALPEEERQLLRRTGTTHLLSVSGLHIALVASSAAGLCALLLSPLAFARAPRLARALTGGAALAAAAAYAGLVGWPVPATRAVWMVGAAVAARALGRSQDAWSALGLAACAVVLLDPAQVAEASALLSFGAVAGILWVGPRVTRWLPPDAPWAARALVGALATTLGATAGTLPVTAWIFQELPPLAPLANLLAVPLVGGIATPAALLAFGAPEPLAGLALRVGDWSARLALALIGPLAVEPLHPAVGPLGAALLAAALPLRRHAALAGLLLLLGLGLRERPRGGLSVTWLSVGQGDAAALRWPDGRVWLVDGGPPSNAVLGWLRRQGITRLEAVILSHPDMDHLGGLGPVLSGVEVGGLWVPRPAREDEPAYAAFLAEARARGVPLRGAEDALPGALLLSPPGASDNDRGLVLLVSHRGTSVLFPGDAEAEAERWLAGRLGPVDVVKVPHHGSRSSSTAVFVEATRPALAVVSVGAGNAFGHPDAGVLQRWARALRTDLDGTVELWTDGRERRLRAWRPGEGWRALEPVGRSIGGVEGGAGKISRSGVDSVLPGG